MNKMCFVTLFNSNYMSRGLVMYESLINQTKDFTLYIIAFDDKAYDKLIELQLENVVVISMKMFEDEELLAVKPTRSVAEYCWSCSAKSVIYVFEHYKEKECTYIDADLMFYNSPRCLFEEMDESKSVLITEHRYCKDFDQTDTAGKYCVQFVYFKNNTIGNQVLQWWKDRCMECCCFDPERGYCGDQKYLDDWCERFQGVHELQNIGGGIAPWNIAKYKIVEDNGELLISENNLKEKSVFYHYHGIVFFDKDVVKITDPEYKISREALKYYYAPYLIMTDYVCEKYNLIDERDIWENRQHFRDEVNKGLQHDKQYFRRSEIVGLINR